MKKSGEYELIRLAGAVSDNAPVEWDLEAKLQPESRNSLDRLRTVESIVAAYRRAQQAVLAPLSIPSQWGPLQVIERIGTGSYGEVYRAIDPTLQREVALKLWRLERFGTNVAADFLNEARRLARVRHPNVLVVYGADEHGGRIGVWTELLHGKTLEECLQEQGPLGAHEAALIGMSLARALAAVHQAGLVHRDVKTTNAMREAGGRIVLMDFGTVREQAGELAGELSSPGTPSFMAPEQLRGGPVVATADIYGLGVVLYRLVTGRFPVEASSLAELREKHERGEHTPLRDLRPDLPTDVVRVIERALEPVPERRFASAGSFEAGLAASLGSPPMADLLAVLPSPRARRRVLWVTGLVGLAGIALVVAWVWQTWERAESPVSRADRGIETVSGASAPETPAAVVPSPSAMAVAGTAPAGGAGVQGELALSPLTATATLLRLASGQEDPLPPGARVFPGDTLVLAIEGSDRMHVYVLDEDAMGEVFVLFPIPGLDLGNPLQDGARHRLPGTRGGKPTGWQVTSGGGRENVVVIASRRPLTKLEREIATFARATPGRPIAYGKVDPSVLEGLRGIGGVVELSASERQRTKRRMTEIVRSLLTRERGPDDPWVWTIELENPPHRVE
jgi:tRNA A-37 threonylcarbamoyl transferase component Bud32